VFYKPKFCCNCGETIDRVDWKPWTSRRFCDVCESEQKHHELLPRVVVAAGMFAGLIGVSAYMTRRQTPPEPVKPAALMAARTKAADVPKPANNSTAANTQPLPAKPVQPDLNNVPLRNVVQTGESEKVYICGAATKKGTPCSRRVKTPGRCWQHKGQPSMLGAATH
jgi:hypothetical protein